MSSLSSATAKHLRNVVPYTNIPFEKQGIQENAEKLKAPLMHLYEFHQLLLIQIKKKVNILIDAMANSRRFLKNTAQQIYEDEVKKGCYESLTRAGAENLIIFGNNVKEIFRFYEELHDMDWRAMMRETLPIFLLPAILTKTWIL
jgi:hypothetical protein